MIKQHTHCYINNWGVHVDNGTVRIFRNGWIDCRDAFHAMTLHNGL